VRGEREEGGTVKRIRREGKRRREGKGNEGERATEGERAKRGRTLTHQISSECVHCVGFRWPKITILGKF